MYFWVVPEATNVILDKKKSFQVIFSHPINMDKEMSQQKLELKREFGVFAGCSLVAAGMIGSGIFLSPGIVLKNCGNFWVSIGVWIITGFIALAGALCYLELALLIPKTGGPYHYLTKGLGKFTGYEYMWINAVFTRPASMAVAALSFAQYTEVFFNSRFRGGTRTRGGEISNFSG